MQVYILVEESSDAVEFISATTNALKARKEFDCYVDVVEKILREQDDNKISSANTFNRFSEPTPEYLFYTSLNDIHIYVKSLEVD